MSVTLQTTHAPRRLPVGRRVGVPRDRRPASLNRRPASLDVRPASLDGPPAPLDPDRLSAHLDVLTRAARSMSRSAQDADDLVQDTLVNVLERPRWLRTGNELGYLLQALRNTHFNRHRAAERRVAAQQLFDHDAPATAPHLSGREILQAIVSAPALYRDAVIAVDLLGLSYREAARSLGTGEATLTTRLHRGRQHVVAQLCGESAGA